MLVFFGEKHTFGHCFMKALKFNQKFDVSISEKTQNFDDFTGFCSPEFGSFLRDLAIFRFKNIMNNIPAFQNVKKHTSNVFITK